jgi:hypothetical protein
MGKDKRRRSSSSEPETSRKDFKSLKADHSQQAQFNDSNSGNDPFMDLFGKTAPPSHKQVQQDKKKEQAKVNEIGTSSRELNPFFKSGSTGIPQTESTSKKVYEFGDAGSNWRMMKMKRVFETAKETGASVLDVALQRYGSQELWEEALAERDFLDGKIGPALQSTQSTNQSMNQSINQKSIIQKATLSSSKVEQPPLRTAGSTVRDSPSLPNIDRTLSPFPVVSSVEPILNKDELNRLKSQALRAKLLKAPNAQDLEKKFELENARSEKALDEVIVLPTIDAFGRLVDLGGEKRAGLSAPQPGESRKKKRDRIENLEAVGESATLEDLVRQERVGAKWDMDADFASRIVKDGGFQNDLEYMDDTAAKIGRKVVKSDLSRKNAAIHGTP